MYKANQNSITNSDIFYDDSFSAQNYEKTNPYNFMDNHNDNHNNHLLSDIPTKEDDENDFCVFGKPDGQYSCLDLNQLEYVPPDQSIDEKLIEKQEARKPKDKEIDKEKVRKDARKNGLQYISSRIWDYHQQLEKQIGFKLSPESKDMLWNLKQSYNIKAFNTLFQQEGELKYFLSKFFQPRVLWKLILSSKVRNYSYKLEFKKVGCIMRKSAIKGYFKGLSNCQN